MNIVLPVENSLGDSISNSFGRCEYFLVYNTDTKNKEVVKNNSGSSAGGAGIAAAQSILDLKGNVLITPRCGQNAYDVLTRGNVEVLLANGISVDSNIKDFLDNKLSKLTTINKGHHGQGHN